MAAQGKALPNAIDEAGKWFWNFLKNELSPYPGRAWVVARVTISATLVMVLVMTFQIPNGFLGSNFYPIPKPGKSHRHVRCRPADNCGFPIGHHLYLARRRNVRHRTADPLPGGCLQSLRILFLDKHH